MSAPRASLARALVGSPIRRPLAGCVFWLAMVLLLLLALLGHVALWLTEPVGGLVVFGGTFLLATLASVPVLLFLWALDRRERESVWLFGGTVLWGAVVSTGLAGILNSLGAVLITGSLRLPAGPENQGLARLLTAALVAPPVEEATKGLALLVLFWFLRAEFDNLRDGLIYGALVGLGFNIAEVALYVMKGYLESGTPPLAGQFAVRFVFLGLNGHLIYSALVGAGLGLARQTARRWLRVVAPLVGYLLATLAHALSNSLGILILAATAIALNGGRPDDLMQVAPGDLWFATAVSEVLVEGPFFIILLILLGLSARWERDVIRLYLADEVGSDAVTLEEYRSILETMPLLGTHRLARQGGRRAARIFNAQTELAFRKWHLSRDHRDPATDPLVTAWREDIAALRSAG
jgi:RsiW-degrading membrane proteinase PrsW (M82 family)